ncbi:MAG: transcription termination/antitermination protein NusG [Candidatus Jacksonbacteria bacterium RIFOXYC2_FULL_44_29]|nr:MAG: Transcription antitermination protein nusG [Parcubacteria group bacterium GW2011_GWC2_44_22]OGY75159.1 MAG: transcription termination/antitermination protein NusG [Candidatus Jacksonbacteria bacterium RIFOXYA2_FULL_43_12]OGY77146.1 MAG: transcription termination/antitermination protein NusG [Candidatus Jacksonbacteria bacterium RIFOXYC2_FULL_44_29]OGY77930.1 MAG: transcription termination/antitermination protein NusG [Candidatus Jacksonbacteria bacterium RIFOXYB2_FULL_44_15]OGY79495.1 M
MAKQISQGKRWYAIHTYSGYEENVMRNLQQRIETFNMQEKIFNVIVPKETKIKIKNGKRKKVRERIFPGYVLVEMSVTDDSWYVVRNTPNVTGFIGTGVIPTPLSQKEIDTIQKRIGLKDPEFNIDVKEGEPVKVIDGPFKDQEGKIQAIDPEHGKVKVLITVFGRETPVELDFLQIKRL